MGRYLIVYAIQNTWCNPGQDNQLIIKPQRITPRDGVYTNFKVMRRVLQLPTKHGLYHIFQIGATHPTLLGLIGVYRPWLDADWLPFSDAMNLSSMLCNIYVDKGVELPRFETYYSYNTRNTLLIAVKANPKFPVDLTKEDIYLRVYSNAYFGRTDVQHVIPKIHTEGRTIKSLADSEAISQSFSNYSVKTGLTYAFINGVYCNDLTTNMLSINDTVEIVYDSSVAKTVIFPVLGLKVFRSTLDTMNKYVLHYPDDHTNQIEFLDDIDFYVLHRPELGKYKGLYYHKNQQKAVRMLTHRDYSISVDYYVTLGEKLKDLFGDTFTLNDFYIQLNIRKSGYNRPIVFEDLRIKELYKLPDSDIVDAINSVNANVWFWKAEDLETSYYTEIMRQHYENITETMAKNAYGYNAISKLIGDTPQLVDMTASPRQVTLPKVLSERSTVFEYDTNGYLIGVHTHTTDSTYEPRSLNCRLVEAISGIGTYRPNVLFSPIPNPYPTPITITLPPDCDYRVYKCYLTVDGPNNEWVDVTDSGDYEVINNVLTWTAYDPNSYVMVRTDRTFLYYELSFVPVDGNLRFTLSEEVFIDGEYVNHAMPVPLGELDIFLNGKSLVPNVDYFFHFPEVTIVNKEYLTANPNSTAQTIGVRYCGFSDSQLRPRSYEEIGFIDHKLLSSNNRYDIRDDRVLRIVVDGSVYDRSELKFRETDNGVEIPDASNGKPYCIRDIVVPISTVVDGDTYTMRELSRDKDKIISDYLTPRLPPPDFETLNVIEERYQIFSPFICKIIFLLINEVITTASLMATLTDNDVLAKCQPYEDWLPFDPIYGDNHPSEGYVIIHPLNINATVELNLFQYRFLLRVVKLYAGNLVDLSTFIQLKPIPN